MLLALFIATGPARADLCERYGDPQQTGETARVRESSGVAASRTRPAVWFTHDDRGGGTVIYAFELDGTLIEEHEVRGAGNVDWEDIAAAPCPRGGDCLYIGDIGDNDRERFDIVVYVVEEPQPGERPRVAHKWKATYPDGPHDAEALLVNPCTGRVHVVTKEADGVARVFRYPASPGGSRVTLDHVADIVVDGAGGLSRTITGGDFDADGDRVVLRTEDRGLEWRVDPAAANAHWGEAPTEIGGIAPANGEAIAYALDGGLVATTEGTPMRTYLKPCDELAPSDHVCDFPYEEGCGCQTGRGPAGLWLLTAMLAARHRRYRKTAIA